MAKDNDYKLTVLEMLIDRQNEYDAYTRDIFNALKKVRKAITAKIHETTILSQGVVHFDDIGARPEINDALFLDIRVEFPIGTVVETEEGNMVTVTEATQHYFNKNIIAGIPLHVIELTKYKDIKAALDVVSHADNDDLDDTIETEPLDKEYIDKRHEMSEREVKVMLLQARNPTGVKH